MTSGIYTITNLLDGKQYVGSAVDLNNRQRKHERTLRAGTHDNQRLQHAWNKYGEASFKFEVLVECAIEDLIAREQYFIDAINPAYNILRVAGSSLGYRHTPEMRVELSRLAKGKVRKPHSLATRLKIAEAHRGVPKSAEHRANFAAARRGTKASATTRARMRAAHLGFVHTAESRRVPPSPAG